MKMIKWGLECLCFSLSVLYCNAQNDAKCVVLLKQADALSTMKSYSAATDLYLKAFEESAACETNSYLLRAVKISLLAGKPDSTFKLLSIIINRKARPIYSFIASDPEFLWLRHDPRWARFNSALQKYLPSVETELDSLRKERMGIEFKMQHIAKEYGINSKNYRTFKYTVINLDSVNSFKVESIIRTYGWPGVDQIEENGERSLLYLYQKLDFKDQKKFYPFISEGFKSGTIDAANFAVMTDKIAFRDKGAQIYGTQYGSDRHLLPVENPDSVNFRRAAIGLPSMKR
jgi:hypothetical protein